MRGGAPLRGGQVIEIDDPGVAPHLALPDDAVEFGVVYEDRDLVVVDKPPGLVVHPGAGRTGGTLVNGLLARYPDIGELERGGSVSPDRPGIVQRLDKGTSGLMVVARTREAMEDLVRQLSQRSVERRYVALAAGRVTEERGVVDAPIGRSLRAPSRMSVAGGGRSARTSYQVLERLDGPEPATLLRLSLETGRTHQIRVHLAAIGHPVLGDETYAPRGPRHTALAGLARGRLFLHAGRLGLRHPATGERMRWDSRVARRSHGGALRVPAGAATRLSPASGGLVGSRDVGVERQSGQGLLLGAADTPNADPELVSGRLQRCRRVAVEAEAQSEHLTL